jgi:hypothetical protein
MKLKYQFVSLERLKLRHTNLARNLSSIDVNMWHQNDINLKIKMKGV